MRVAVLGLGEAGSVLAADLVDQGDEVHGYDPADVPTPAGVSRHQRPGRAVAGCDLVLAVTHGSQARAALSGVLDELEEVAVYADLSTGPPRLKEELAAMASLRGCAFVDVAVMSPVPGRGLAAPALASGDGARRFADMVNARGGNVQVLGDKAGRAAERKLLRSVVMKGLAALLIESMEAGRATGQDEWLWGHLVDQLTTLDVGLLERLLYDTSRHARRRVEEMEAARELLAALGVPADMTNATFVALHRLHEDGRGRPLRPPVARDRPLQAEGGAEGI